jgi:ketosteroid isomerase-like protein
MDLPGGPLAAVSQEREGKEILMTQSIRFLMGAVLALGAATASVTLSEWEDGKRIDTTRGRATRTAQQNAAAILEIFGAVERRDERRFNALSKPDVEVVWPPSLPYGGTTRPVDDDRPTWSQTWEPLQPTEREREMDPRVVAASDDEVVVLWRQRGVTAAGDRFDGQVLGLYRLQDGKLARAQMFYFDTVAVAGFLAKAKGE